MLLRTVLETDGPYAGNPCGSHDHDHYDAADSVEMQWRGQAEFYSLMREHGVFVHAPDDYLFAGGANKECGGKPEDHPSKRRAGRPQERHFVYRLRGEPDVAAALAVALHRAPGELR